jgi:hypothetical protein
MKSKLITCFIFIGLLFISNNIIAQPGFDDDVVDTPIDNGISLLVGFGIIFGFRVLSQNILNEIKKED